ncbi:MAG: RES family NAD+ phosphorylase [Terracidiphilus sp.]|jgi:RES domain-containing protein
MTSLWRISNFIDLSGEGGLGASGRWHTEGRLVVYLADCPAGALLERIVHMTDMYEEAFLPHFYQLLKVAVPDELVIKQLNTLAPVDWKEHTEFTRAIGDAWLASLETPLARIPSAIVPQTWNYLLNPEHPEAKQVKVAEVIQERFDNRLFRFGVR